MPDSTPFKDDLQIDNLPNRLTIFRIALIPFVLIFLWLAKPEVEFLSGMKSNFGWAAAWIFIFAGVTDFFDGYIARKRDIVTVFGSFLDPIADKFLTVSTLIMLGSMGRIHAFIVIVLVLREMYMTSLRLLAMNEGVTVPVNSLGKWKTALMMVGIPFLMAYEPWSLIPSIPFSLPGSFFIYVAGVISLWSAVLYTYNMIQKLKSMRALKRKKNMESPA